MLYQPPAREWQPGNTEVPTLNRLVSDLLVALLGQWGMLGWSAGFLEMMSW